MTSLKVNINNAQVPIGMWAVPGYDSTVKIDFDLYPLAVIVSGLDDWTVWQNEFIQTLATMNGDNQSEADLITFEII
jgi:hypothetical protein